MSPKQAVVGAALGLALAVPGAANAKPIHGTLIQVDRAHHTLRLVESSTKVESLLYRGRLDRRIRSGSIVRLRASGHRASHVRFAGRAHRVQVVGHVVRSSASGAVVSLPDGRTFTLSSTTRSAHRALVTAAGAVSLSFDGLQPGQTVLVTIDYAPSGDVSINIKLAQDPSQTAGAGSTDGSGGGSGDGSGDSSGSQSSGGGSGDGSGDQGSGSGSGSSCGDPTAADGSVVAINHVEGNFTLSDRWSDTTTYAATAAMLNHIHGGDQVLVEFDASDPATATAVVVLQSSAGPADPGYGTADGIVHEVLGDAGQFVVDQTNHAGPLTFDASCAVLNQVWQSEDVHVVYHQDASGDLIADAVDAGDGSEL